MKKEKKSLTHHVLIIPRSVPRATDRIKAKAAPVHWALREMEASSRITVIDCLIDRLTLFNVSSKPIVYSLGPIVNWIKWMNPTKLKDNRIKPTSLFLLQLQNPLNSDDFHSSA